jgi:hypothetical protein
MWLAWLAGVLAATPLPVDGDTELDSSGPWPPPEPIGLNWSAEPSVLTVGPGHASAWEAVPAEPFSVLVLAWGYAGDARDGQVVAIVKLAYADGEAHTVKARLGDQVFDVSTPQTASGLQPLSLGGDQALGLFQLRNPRPDEAVSAVTLRARGGGTILLGAAATAPDTVLPSPSVRPPLDGFTFALPTDTVQPQPIQGRIEGPAGLRGFVTERDGHLVDAQGERVRFWGVNLLGPACAPPKDQAAAFARTLAGAGVNLVRLHHCDGDRAGIVRSDRDPGTPLFDAEALDRYDWFVAALRDAGVHLFLEGATSRRFTPADGLEGTGAGLQNGHKWVPMFDPAWHDAYLAWLGEWLGRENPYTGLTPAQDPAVVLVELTNEHSLIAAWSAGQLERLALAHRQTLDGLWNAWLEDRYGDQGPGHAWIGSAHPGLQPEEGPGTVRRAPEHRALAAAWPDQRARDLLDFYASLEEAFFVSVRDYARDQLGIQVPLIGTTNFNHPTVGVLQENLGLVPDTHGAWDRTGSPVRLGNRSLLADPRGSPLAAILATPVHERPFVISELGHRTPNDYAAEAPLTWAALAAVQDWDALIWLHYVNGPWDSAPTHIDSPNALRAASDRWAQFGVASALFRSGDVAAAKGLLPLHVDSEGVRADPVALTELPELADLSLILGHRIRRVVDRPEVAPVAGTPGNQVGWWREPGRLVIVTPRIQALVGAPGAPGGEGAGPRTAPRLDVALEQFAAVSLASLDGEDLDATGHALLTVATRSENGGSVRTAGGEHVLVWGTGATVQGRATGTVRFAWEGRPVVRPLAADGTPGEPVPVERAGRGWWALPLASAGDTLWWDISR